MKATLSYMRQKHNILVLKSILRCFELAYELKVSFSKSKIEGGFGQMYYRKIFRGYKFLSIVYLGMLVGEIPGKNILQGIIEKMKK